ncbi:MAG: major facilitator superfamily domain-containing protein 6 [Burkholderiaceae bacterium]
MAGTTGYFDLAIRHLRRGAAAFLPQLKKFVSLKPWPEQAFNFGFFFFAYYGFIGIFSPYASLFFAHRGITPPQIGVLMSLMQVMRIFGPTLWGWVADRTRQRVGVLRLTALAATLMFMGMFFGRSFAEFFIIMAAVNTFTSAQGPLSEALMLSTMRDDLTHYGRLRLWGSIGFIAAVTLGGELLDWRGIELLPWMSWGMLGLVLLASLRLRETAPRRSQALPSIMAILRRREVLAFFGSSFLMIGAHASLYVFLSLYLAQIGYSKTVIGLLWSVGVLAEIGFFYYQAPLFRRFGVRALLLASLLAAVLRFLIIGCGATSLPWLIFAQMLHAASFGAHHSASVMRMQRWFSGPLQASGQALYISISYGLGGTIGGLLMSACWDILGAGSVFIAGALLALLGLVAAVLSFRWQMFPCHDDRVAKG